MKIDGRCHCGRITYEAEINPDHVSICHCTDCQSLTGTVFRVSVVAQADRVKLTGAEPTIYTKLAESGAARLQLFCGACGAPLFTTGEGREAGIWGIRWGSIRQCGELTPRRQEWCRSAVSWLGEIADLPASERE